MEVGDLGRQAPDPCGFPIVDGGTECVVGAISAGQNSPSPSGP